MFMEYGVTLITRQTASARSYVLTVLACALTTALALPLLDRVDQANIVLLFVMLVVLVATYGGRGPAVLASFLAVACFDFFFVPPRFSFTVAHAQYLITFAVMLAVSLIISQLTNAYREKAMEAECRASASALLYELAEALSGAPTLEIVAERLATLVHRHLDAEAILLLPLTAGGHERLAVPGHAVNFVEQAAAHGVYVSGKPVETNGDLHDGVLTALFPLEGATRRRGVLALHFPQIGHPHVDAALLSAMAAVVATAVERIHFVDVAHATTLDMQTERLRSAILSALSHDLRTPLTVLYGLADSLAQRPDLAADDQATALMLRDQSHRLSRMVDNLLDLARLRSGRIELRRDWQAIPELVGAAAQSLRPWLDSQRLQFAWPHDLPLVELDAVLMERVLCNLLENAAKYSPANSPISLAARVSDDARWLQVWIDNSGAGFPAERIARLFEIFERGSSESPVSGVGIGLAVCRAIIEAHGGRIEATNRSGGGARVLIELPLAATPDIPE